MSDNMFDEPQFDTYDPATGQPVESNAMRTLREKIKADALRIKELETKVNTYEVKETRTSVAELLKNKGANPALAKFALADGVKPTEEAVAAWVAENGSLFGVTPQEPAASQEPTPPGQQAPNPAVPSAPQGQPNITEAAAQVLMQVLNAQAGSMPAQFQDQADQIKNVGTEAELLAMINAAPRI